MSSINPIKLNENKEISVKVLYPDGEIAYTDISLKYGSMPKIKIRGDVRDKNITVQSIHDDYFDTYYISDIQEHNFFYPSIFKYLYIGNADKDNLKKVYFTVPELSSFFHREIQYELDHHANLSGNLKIEPLEVNLEALGLSIKIHQGYSLKANDDHTGFSFKNIIYFSFESEKPLSFQDIEKLMYKTIGLLTWITGYPISIDAIDVHDGEKSGYLYLPLVKKIKMNDVSFPKSFMEIGFFREYFHIICSKYFEKNEIFEDIWSRTLPLFDFTGVLEYEVMLYASILDRYFSYQVEKLEIDKGPNYDSYIFEIESFLKNNEDFKKILDDTDLLTKLEIKNIFPSKEARTFIQKQKNYFRYLGENNLKIFIEKEDFFNIKSIRDRAAHGAKEELDTTTVLKYLWKVKALTMYFIYRDLGIKEDDFLTIFSLTHHPIAMNCEVNKYQLDLATGKSILIELAPSEKEKFEKLGTKIKVFKKQNNRYIFNSELSQRAHDYFSEDLVIEYDPSRFYSYEKYVQHLLDQKSLDIKAKLYSEAYIKQKKDKILINNVIILS